MFNLNIFYLYNIQGGGLLLKLLCGFISDAFFSRDMLIILGVLISHVVLLFPRDTVNVLRLFFTCKKHENEGKRKTTTDDSAEIKKRSLQELLSDLKRKMTSQKLRMTALT